jgi:hypothetical protein
MSEHRPRFTLALAVALATAAIPMLTPSGFPVAQATGSSCTASSSTSGVYTVVRFEGAGSCSWTPPIGLAAADLLVVGGGGGGGGGKPRGTYAEVDAGSGGGGGGGHVTVADNTPISSPVDVVVGAGGTGGSSSSADFYETAITFGGVGGTSSFGSVTASGGGPGSPATQYSYLLAGGDGGSSGRHINGFNASTIGGLNRWDGAGGGAGAGSGGGLGTDLGGQGGNGGAGGGGHTSMITGSAVQYGGGGGGGGVITADNLSGEGGDGTGGGGYGGGRYSAATAGTDGLGGGGGGGGYKDSSTSAAGGRGGDGIVIIRYFTSARDLVVTTAPGNRQVDGSLQTPVVQIQNGSGSPVSLAGRTVTASLTTGGGTLTNATAVTDASGTATFPGFALDAGTGSYVVTFTSDLLASASSGITISPVPTPTPTPTPEPAAQMPAASPTPSPSVSSTMSTPTSSASASPPARVVTPPAPGTSSVDIGGRAVLVRNQRLARGQGLTVRAAPISVSVRSTTADGRRLPLSQGGTLMVTPSGDVPVSASGFEPGSTLTQTLHSTPTSLGSGRVDASGTFTGTVTIPADAPPGAHTLVLDGTARGGSPVILRMGVIAATPTVALGADPIVTVRRGTDHAASVLQVHATEVQPRCMVTFHVAKQHRTVRASPLGRTSVQFSLPSTAPSSITVKAQVRGSGCALRSVVETTTPRRS